MASGYNKPLYNQIMRERRKSANRALVGDIASSLLRIAPWAYSQYKQQEIRGQNSTAAQNLARQHPELGYTPDSVTAENYGDIAAALNRESAFNREFDKGSIKLGDLDNPETRIPYGAIDDALRAKMRRGGGAYNVTDPKLQERYGKQIPFENESLINKIEEMQNPKAITNPTALKQQFEMEHFFGDTPEAKAYQQQVDRRFADTLGVEQPEEPMAPIEPQSMNPLAGNPLTAPMSQMQTQPEESPAIRDYRQAVQKYEADMMEYRTKNQAYSKAMAPYAGRGRYSTPDQVNTEIKSIRLQQYRDNMARLQNLKNSTTDARERYAIDQAMARLEKSLEVEYGLFYGGESPDLSGMKAVRNFMHGPDGNLNNNTSGQVNTPGVGETLANPAPELFTEERWNSFTDEEKRQLIREAGD